MARNGFMALAWPPQAGAAAETAKGIARRLAAETDWRPAASLPGLAVWTRGVGLAVRQLPDETGVAIGEVFPPRGADASPLEQSDTASREPVDLARRFSRAAWGRYVLLLRDLVRGGAAAYRDPSGALECLFWSLEGGLQFVGSDLPAAPGWLQPRRLGLHWDRIARFVATPSASTTPSLLDGVEAVDPGGFRRLDGGGQTLVWAPADFVQKERQDPAELAADLVRRVDHCTAALCEGHERLLVELSGGLDSSIVAAALAQTGQAGRVAVWLNRAGERPEADERAYAAAVTDRLGASLTAIPKPREPITPAVLGEMAGTFRPSISAVDGGSDRDAAQRLGEARAGAVVSGQGGDAVFFQMPSALVFADAWPVLGWSAVSSGLLADVARRTHGSVWRVVAEVVAERRGRAPPSMPPSVFVTSEVRAALAADSLHVWVRDARERDVSLAKRLQIEAIANCHLFHDESRQAAAAELLFPLLAQPVVELCLAIPAFQLAGGAYDRPFARRAFAERLPDAVRLRRAKGSMGAFFTRLVAESLETLRPFLLDGCLCEARVLDREVLDGFLDPVSLIQVSHATEILWAVAVEAWVRRWQGRVPDSAASPRARG